MPFRDSPMLFLGALLRGHSGARGAPSGRFPRRPVAYRRRTLYGAEDRTTGRIYVSSTTVDLADTRTPTSLLRWYVLILTCFIYAINIADRYVVSTVLEQIRLDLHLTDSGVAILTGWPLAIFYGTFGIALSWLADRVNRRNILAVSLLSGPPSRRSAAARGAIWSSCSARVGVGIGEAGGTPPSTAIVSDYFPAERRPMAMTVLALGAPIGALLGAEFCRLRGESLYLARRFPRPGRARTLCGSPRLSSPSVSRSEGGWMRFPTRSPPRSSLRSSSCGGSERPFTSSSAVDCARCGDGASFSGLPRSCSGPTV